MLRHFTLVVMYVLSIVVVANANTDTDAESELRGFAGYAYESGINSIADDMEASGFTLISRSHQSLWYQSRFLEIPCELGYVFVNGSLVGGAMVLAPGTKEDFARVHMYMIETYDSPVSLRVDGEKMVATISGPDSTIIQTFDPEKRVHEIEYIRERE